MAVFTSFTRHRVFCANGIVMIKNESFLKVVMFFWIVFPAVIFLSVQWDTYIVHFVHIKVDLAPFIIYVTGQTTKYVCWDIVFVIALFAMYHRKILAEENGLINCFIFRKKMLIVSALQPTLFDVERVIGKKRLFYATFYFQKFKQLPYITSVLFI